METRQASRHECAPPRSPDGELPPFDTLWRCGCGRVWAVAYQRTLDVDGGPGATVRAWTTSSRLRWIKRFGLRA